MYLHTHACTHVHIHVHNICIHMLIVYSTHPLCLLGNLQECWDKDIFSDDFMGSIALTHKDLDTFSVRNSLELLRNRSSITLLFEKTCHHCHRQPEVVYNLLLLLLLYVQGGARWCKLEHVKHGQLLLRLSLTPGWGGGGGEEETVEEVKWSHLDEASRQLVGQGGCVFISLSCI